MALPLWGAEEKAVTTNTDFLMGMISQGFNAEIGQLDTATLHALTGKTLYLHSSRPHQGDWLVEYAAVDIFNKMNVRVIKELNRPAPLLAVKPVVRDTTAPESLKAGDTTKVKEAQKDTTPVVVPDNRPEQKTGFILEYRLIDCYLEYDKVWRKGFLGPKEMRRVGRAGATLQLEDGATGAILWQKKMEAQAADAVAYASKLYVENNDYNFVRTNTVPPYWKELVEITLAGGSVGYLLYIFFSKSFN
jgi:hypothetical protein